MKKYRKWILMSIAVCVVLALVYPVYAVFEEKEPVMLRATQGENVECSKDVPMYHIKLIQSTAQSIICAQVEFRI